MLKYIDLNYKPSRKELVCEFYVEPNRITIEQASEYIAGESSIGTWTTLSTMNEKIAKKLKPHIFSINHKTNEVKIAYPPELFEEGNMPQIYSSIAGNIFGMKAINNLRLQDIHFPKSHVNAFKGPRFGIPGIRKLLKVRYRPLVGTIVKPKVGLSETQHAKVAYDSWIGGLDVVKDDENLSSMKFNNFNKRISATLARRDKAEDRTGEKKIYMPNITAETNEMLKRAEYVKSQGGEYIMVDIMTAGWGGLQTIRDANLGMVIHAHRAMHGAITRNRKHGISMLTIAKTARLIGVDQLHIGTAVGKMEGGRIETENICDEVEDNFINKKTKQHILEQSWYDKKPVFAVASGGLYPGLVPQLMKILGKNIIMQFGGGCHGHPSGTVSGARAIRQATDAAMKKQNLRKYSGKYTDLAKAIEKWGI